MTETNKDDLVITSTNRAAQSGIKVLVFGAPGSGKTRLCATLPKPTLILSAEAGLLSLREHDIPVMEIKRYDDMRAAYKYCADPKKSSQFKAVALDSISEIAEQCLEQAKKEKADARQAYGDMSSDMLRLLKAFRDLPDKHIYMSCKEQLVMDTDSGVAKYVPLTPGKQLGANLPYIFDEVFHLTRTDDGKEVLQCCNSATADVKDRSGALAETEPADLGAIIKKIEAAVGTDKPTKRSK